MQVQNIDPNATTINDEHHSEGNGVFTVPDDLAAELVKFPQWRYYDGQPWPHEKTPEELEAERVAALVQQAIARVQPPPSKPKARSLGRRLVAASKKASSAKSASKSATK